MTPGGTPVVKVPGNPRINVVDGPGFEEFATWYGDNGYS